MAISTKGLKIYIQKAVAPGPSSTVLVPTAISSAAPAVVTVANSLAAGDLIYCENTGFTELDGKYFTVGNPTGTEFELIGSDTSGTVDSLDAAPEIIAYELSDDMQIVCASAITVDANVPGTISVATFCNLNASIPSVITEPGNVTLTLYHEPELAGFQELQAAYEDGAPRVLAVVFPFGGGTLIGGGVVSGFTVSDVPLDGAAAWTATFALSAPLDFAY